MCGVSVNWKSEQSAPGDIRHMYVAAPYRNTYSGQRQILKWHYHLQEARLDD